MKPWMRYTETTTMPDEEWSMEQKLDGTCVITDGREFYARTGHQLKHTAATQHLPALRLPRPLRHPVVGELVIDTGVFTAFDILIEGMPHYRRREALLDQGGYPVARQWLDGDRQEALDALRERGMEGAVFKYLDGLYQPGATTADIVKLKFVKRAELVVIDWIRPDARHGSAALGVHDDQGRLVQVASASLIGKPPVTTGTVVEVDYLYWTGGGLIQPRIVRVREDKAPTDCTIDQFKPYSRDIL